MKRVLSFAFGLAGSHRRCHAQKLDPIQWTLTSDFAKAPAGSSVPLHLKATFQEGWHLYSLTTPKGGPIPTTAELAENPAVKSVEAVSAAAQSPVRQEFQSRHGNI